MPVDPIIEPILLTGIATCASCGGGMTLRTGKSGRYSATMPARQPHRRARPPVRAVRFRWTSSTIAVMDRIADELLTPARVADMLRGLMERQTKRDSDHANRLTALRGKLSEAETRLGRLYQAIENGIADPSDATLKDRVAAVKTERDIAKAAFDRAVSEMSPEDRITEDKIAAFVETMRSNVLSGDTPFRRA